MIKNVKNPRWMNGKTSIQLEVQSAKTEEWISFVASPTDCTEYGPMLYNFALNGLFGEILASDEERIIAGELPVPEGYTVQDGKIVNLAALEQEATAELQRRLGELQTPEALALAEIDEEYAAERKIKITALLAVKQQADWPVTVEWPE
jgi:hypothetical protein